MEELIQKSIVSLILVLAVIGIIAFYTNAAKSLVKLGFNNLIFFTLACIFFLLGVLLWVISWAFLVRKFTPISYKNLFLVGFSSLYGALTPVQLGTDALRSISLKKHFQLSYFKSIAASMTAKGTKFLVIAIVFILVILMFLSRQVIDSVIFFSLISGFIVILLASTLFLLPLNKRISIKLSQFFKRLGRIIPLFEKIGKFFLDYSSYMKKFSLNAIIYVFLLGFLSWVFEFLALQFTFFAVLPEEKNLGLIPILVLFVLISVLERTPFLPRGIGVVEFIGFTYLNMVSRLVTSLQVSQIGAVLILYDVVRLIIPTILSLIIAFAFKVEAKESELHHSKKY
ncbi:MAG: flippase-like domain-containing protein [Candidatus Diapherotrites archaeon]